MTIEPDYYALGKAVLIQENGYIFRFWKSKNNLTQGDITKNIEFKMGANTINQDSCAAELNGEMYIFGGTALFLEHMPGLYRQVTSQVGDVLPGIR